MINFRKTISEIKFINSSKGYTIIELLAVMIVLSAVGAVIIGIISSTLRGANKTTSLNEIRQEGDNRLSGMSKMIEFARSFDGISVDGVSYQQNCTVEPVEPLTPTPEPTRYYYLKVTNFTNDQLIFSCNIDQGTNEPTLSSNSASLIDTNAIVVSGCYFTCSQNYLSQPPVIGIYFTLSKNSSGNVTEQNTSVPFETNVTMRNLGR